MKSVKPEQQAKCKASRSHACAYRGGGGTRHSARATACEEPRLTTRIHCSPTPTLCAPLQHLDDPGHRALLRVTVPKLALVRTPRIQLRNLALPCSISSTPHQPLNLRLLPLLWRGVDIAPCFFLSTLPLSFFSFFSGVMRRSCTIAMHF